MTSLPLESQAISPLRLRRRPPHPQSALLAAIFGLLIPGGGQLYVGRPGKALMMLLGIGGLIAAGGALTGWTCVNKDTHRLEFLAHLFNLGPTVYLLNVTKDLQVTEYLRWYEVGRQYVAIAGLLNIVAICDAWGHVLSHNRRAHSWNRILTQRARNAERRTENERVRQLLTEQERRLETSSFELPALEPEDAAGPADAATSYGEDDPS